MYTPAFSEYYERGCDFSSFALAGKLKNSIWNRRLDHRYQLSDNY